MIINTGNPDSALRHAIKYLTVIDVETDEEIKWITFLDIETGLVIRNLEVGTYDVKEYRPVRVLLDHPTYKEESKLFNDLSLEYTELPKHYLKERQVCLLTMEKILLTICVKYYRDRYLDIFNHVYKK